jgi:hypothetical protein
MVRTYPEEIELTPTQSGIISDMRIRIGDPIVIYNEYIASTETSARVISSTTYYNSDIRFWPYNISINGTTCSGLTNPDVLTYQYLKFTDTLTSKTLDFWLESFKLSNTELITLWENASLTGIVFNESCITAHMLFLKACLDALELLRTRSQNESYNRLTVEDADTRFVREPQTGIDPLKDLYQGISTELNQLIEYCNKKPFSGGVRLE